MWSGYLSIHYVQYDNHDKYTDAHKTSNTAFHYLKVCGSISRYEQEFLFF